MSRRIGAWRTAPAALLLALPVFGQTSGPERGALVAVGGAMRDPAILERFVRLAGGPEAPVVVIPTAGGAAFYDRSWPGLEPFRRAGLADLAVLHTTDRGEADTEAFAAPLRRARGVWFTGGRQWRLADAYLRTRTHEALEGVLARGGVIGGSSAGATILGSYLARGDTSGNTIMMGDHEEGFGFIRNIAIDQHLLRRNRHFDLLEIVQARPELLGIGLDEDTAIVVRGGRFEVIGRGNVAVYDRNRMLDSGGRFYFLQAGDEFSLAERAAWRPRRVLEPLERVVERPWRGADAGAFP